MKLVISLRFINLWLYLYYSKNQRKILSRGVEYHITVCVFRIVDSSAEVERSNLERNRFLLNMNGGEIFHKKYTTLLGVHSNILCYKSWEY
jgi:hypothetical protein